MILIEFSGNYLVWKGGDEIPEILMEESSMEFQPEVANRWDQEDQNVDSKDYFYY